MADYSSFEALRLRRFPSDYLSSNSYLLSIGNHAVVIDPCRNEEFFAALKGLKVDSCILTHEHYDHINGANELKAQYHCPVICSCICGERIQNPKLNAARYYPAFVQMQTRLPATRPELIDIGYSCKTDAVFEYERVILWRGYQLFLKETPGHSPGSICIVINQRILFTGDTLMKGQMPYTRFPGGSLQDFKRNTIPFLSCFSGETIVYPGHGEPFLLKDAVFNLL